MGAFFVYCRVSGLNRLQTQFDNQPAKLINLMDVLL